MDEVTPVIVGAVVSITIASFAARELAVPGVGKVKTAALPGRSKIVPPFSERAEVEV